MLHGHLTVNRLIVSNIARVASLLNVGSYFTSYDTIFGDRNFVFKYIAIVVLEEVELSGVACGHAIVYKHEKTERVLQFQYPLPVVS